MNLHRTDRFVWLISSGVYWAKLKRRTRSVWYYRKETIVAFGGAVIGATVGALWFTAWNVDFIWGEELFLATLSIPYEGRRIAELMRDVVSGAILGLLFSTYWMKP